MARRRFNAARSDDPSSSARLERIVVELKLVHFAGNLVA